MNAVSSLGQCQTALVAERQSHNRHRKNAVFLGQPGDYRRGSGTRAAAKSGSDEKHPRTALGNPGQNFILAVDGGFPGKIRVGSSTEPVSELELDGDVALEQSLGVRVANHESAALYILPVHVGHGIASSATDADDLYHCLLLLPVGRGHNIGIADIVCHSLTFFTQSHYSCH